MKKQISLLLILSLLLLACNNNDKKNEEGHILFSLLEKIGHCTFNCKVNQTDILESLTYYNLNIL